MLRKGWLISLALVACAKTDRTASADSTAASSTAAGSTAACGSDNSGLTVPAGFCATVFADSLGHPRDIVIASNGDAYVNTWSGKYYGNRPPPPGGFIVALRDTNNDGKADIVKRFGPDASKKNEGG